MDFRIPTKSSQRAASNGGWYIFLLEFSPLIFEKTGENIVPTKIDNPPLNSPRRAVFTSYLGSARALTDFWQIDFNWFISPIPLSILFVDPFCPTFTTAPIARWVVFCLFFARFRFMTIFRAHFSFLVHYLK